MPVSLPTDDQLDPLEQADLEEEMPDSEEEDVVADDGSTPAGGSAPEIDPEIAEEIKRVMVPDLVEDPTAVKAKGHFIPQSLIDRPLDPSTDLWDEDGSI